MFAMFLPPHSMTEQITLKQVTTMAPMVSGWKLDTEETSKQKLKYTRELLWKWQVKKIKTL